MFRTEVTVNFFDCDPAGIMFFGNIFKIAHAAYEEMLKKGNLKRDYFNDSRFAIPILHSEADFLKAIMPGERVEAEVNVSLLKESSFELSYEVLNKKGEVLARVKTVHVTVNRQTWEKAPLPGDLKDYLRGI
ncbi:MAG: acyl-CoA thioesterase [Ignavibacteria bacterium]|jgi:acyl-CoA thioester hydrolase/1,4-dihydroxy-2-naphthoyl-CoA hydrolase|nr:acyl-CoA thioesterase [Ignavibacteria bacterium]MCU7504134.1 acyl-CoA thioesterase [Ignavibacteria bacterium]MCU7516416.1 acyl-CoA thioesterase [Ignavibacteria bacterium]